MVACNQLEKAHGIGKRWRKTSYICFASKATACVLLPAEGTWLLLREVLPSWERLVRSKGDEEYGRGKGSNPFSTVISCSTGLLSEVNHSPEVFAKLALETDEVLISHGQR